MTFTLEFADSEIRDVLADRGALRVHFAAASVRDAENRRGWIPSVQLMLEDTVATGDLHHAFGKIAEGRLRHDGHELDRLALPHTLSGGLELTLRLANGTLLALQARTLIASVDADARFTEDLSC